MPPRLLPPSCRTVFMFCLAACRVMDTAHGRILGNNVGRFYARHSFAKPAFFSLSLLSSRLAMFTIMNFFISFLCDGKLSFTTMGSTWYVRAATSSYGWPTSSMMPDTCDVHHQLASRCSGCHRSWMRLPTLYNTNEVCILCVGSQSVACRINSTTTPHQSPLYPLTKPFDSDRDTLRMAGGMPLQR